MSTAELAKNIRRDFPNLTIKASCIANIGYNEKTVLKELEQAFEYYDIVTLHQKMWNNEKILTQIKEKDRICLFADTSCAPFCKTQGCYHNMSLANFYGYDHGQKKRACRSKKIIENLAIECGDRWKTINFQKPLHPMYEGMVHFKYGVRRFRSNVHLYRLLKKQGHPGYEDRRSK